MKSWMLSIACLVAATSLVAAPGIVSAQEEKDDSRGLKIHEPGAFDGLNLFAPLMGATTYLMDNEGRVINTWESDYGPGQPYLLPNGNLLRNGGFGLTGNGTFHGGGAGYRVEEFNWEGERVWDFVYASDQYLMHHDIEPLPNGNVLILAWEMKTEEEAIAAGRNPEVIRDGEIWSEHIIEVKPIRPEGGEIVWEWHLWDHLIQDFDESKDNYGDVALHPELLDIDPPGFWMDRMTAEEMEELEALGYLGADDKEKQEDDSRRGGNADWLHTNAIAYNPELDLIALSVLGNNELWVIDHSPTTEQTKTHSGGNYGKGGDLLYRWGNPLAYRLGTDEDQTLFAQHNVHWIAEGLPGAGDIMLFNNGRGRKDGTYSSITQITPPFTKDKGFHRAEGEAWGPTEPTWAYTAPNKKDFNSFFISGAQRLPNGNTLICEGAKGTFFEVTADKKEVWRYLNAANPPPAKKKIEESDKKPKDDDKKAEDDNEKAEDGGENAEKADASPPRNFLTNTVFRVYRYPRDYAGLAGKDLSPGPVLLDYLKDHPTKTPLKLDDVYPSDDEEE